MRVAVDATPLLTPSSGVPVVTRALLEGLGAHPDVDAAGFALSLRGRRSLATSLPPGVRAVGPPIPARVAKTVWGRAGIPPIEWLVGGVDVVHGPNFVVPPARAPRVVTVHDLTCVRFPELCEPWTLRYPRLIERAAAAGAWVHTVSHAVADEVVATLDVDPARVVAVPNGFSPVDGEAAAAARIVGDAPYVLAVGTVEPRKNLPLLLRAVDRLAAEHPDLRLVHAGGDGWGTAALDDAVAAMAHPDRFVRLGRVDLRTLADLYVGARLLAYPSVYEGFGLPVLEAMSARTPVVATDVPAVREVAGDAAVLVGADADELAAAIATVWTDHGRREELRRLGDERCERYSWPAMVAGMVDLYRRAVAAG